MMQYSDPPSCESPPMSARAPEGALRPTGRTHCPYCAFQCGMLVEQGVESQTGAKRPLVVRADPDFPVNRGQMCIKGFNAGALLEVAERLSSPLLRDASGA